MILASWSCFLMIIWYKMCDFNASDSSVVVHLKLNISWSAVGSGLFTLRFAQTRLRLQPIQTAEWSGVVGPYVHGSFTVLTMRVQFSHSTSLYIRAKIRDQLHTLLWIFVWTTLKKCRQNVWNIFFRSCENVFATVFRGSIIVSGSNSDKHLCSRGPSTDCC